MLHQLSDSKQLEPFFDFFPKKKRLAEIWKKRLGSNPEASLETINALSRFIVARLLRDTVNALNDDVSVFVDTDGEEFQSKDIVLQKKSLIKCGESPFSLTLVCTQFQCSTLFLYDLNSQQAFQFAAHWSHSSFAIRP